MMQIKQLAWRGGLASAALFMLLSAPCLASNRPAASLNIVSRSLDGAWRGSGDLTLRAELCIASDSGRYQLTIAASPLFRDRIGETPIRITFRDQSGAEQTGRLDGRAILSFEGVTAARRADCADGRLSELALIFPERLLTAQQAGDYMSQLSLAVHPL